MPGANRSEALITPDSIDMLSDDGGRRKLIYFDPRFTKTLPKQMNGILSGRIWIWPLFWQ